jgi:hypothetical protein
MPSRWRLKQRVLRIVGSKENAIGLYFHVVLISHSQVKEFFARMCLLLPFTMVSWELKTQLNPNLITYSSL